MKNKFSTFLFLLVNVAAFSQVPVGTWSDHLNYSTADAVVAGNDEVFASTGASILIFDKSVSELRKLSHTNGLTETGISAIAWSEEYRTLVIGYLSTGIDLVIGNMIYNIPDIERKYIPGRKAINRIRISGKYAYLACSFGIVVVDIEKKEIRDTWKPCAFPENTEVYDIASGGGKIYAATGFGIYYAGENDTGLSYPGNWDLMPGLPDPAGKYTNVIFSGNKVIATLSGDLSGGDSLYMLGSPATLLSSENGIYINSLDSDTQGFTASSELSVKYYNSSGVLQRTISSYSWAAPNISQAVPDGNDIWIADIANGLILGEGMTTFNSMKLPGPVSNNAYSITSLHGKTAITGGGATAPWNNQMRPLQVSAFENGSWMPIVNTSVTDAMRCLIDPSDADHIYISSWGGGLLEYRNNILVKKYDDSNSPLQTIIPGRPYVRVCGLAMDKNRNLWMTQSEVPGSLKALKPDGSWIVNPVTIGLPAIGDLVIAANGYKWVLLPKGNGIFVLDDNGTPENFTDDRSVKMAVRDNDGKSVSNVFSIAQDLDGNMWIGTDQGPFIYYNPDRIFDAEIFAYRIKIPRNDGTGFADYLLGTETITSIAIDGGNRKWLGTSASGAYLISADGLHQLNNYREDNSPILSNSIVSLAVDDKTGEVWFGTSRGLQSLRGDATSGGEIFSGVYAFPNPVRDTFSGNVTITGLVRETRVKITDVSGNLVFETISEGGLAQWNLLNYRGQRVATGVYLAFCSAPDKQAVVTKILVIR